VSPDEELAALKALVRDYCAAERRAEDARASVIRYAAARRPSPAKAERLLRAASLAADEARELLAKLRAAAQPFACVFCDDTGVSRLLGKPCTHCERGRDRNAVTP
jgi:hypothetical protein